MGRDEPKREQSEPLEPAKIHDVLRNERRRLVIDRLREHSGSESVRDLSEHIAAVETGDDPPPRNVRQSVYVSLHQTHLPKLDQLDIVEYDSDAKKVTLAARADEVAVYMEVVPKYGISWGEYYLGIGLLGLVSMLAAELGIPVFAAVGVAVFATVTLAIIVASAVYHITTQESSLLHRLRE